MDGVCVEVKQTSGHGDCRGEHRKLGQLKVRPDTRRFFSEGCREGCQTTVDSKRSSKAGFVSFGDAWDAMAREKAEHPLVVDRLSCGQPQSQLDATWGLAAVRSPLTAELGWRAVIDGTDRVVELSNARESGGEGCLGDWHRRGLEQDAGQVRTMGSRQCLRPSAQLFGEHAV